MPKNYEKTIENNCPLNNGVTYFAFIFNEFINLSESM